MERVIYHVFGVGIIFDYSFRLKKKSFNALTDHVSSYYVDQMSNFATPPTYYNLWNNDFISQIKH